MVTVIKDRSTVESFSPNGLPDLYILLHVNYSNGICLFDITNHNHKRLSGSVLYDTKCIGPRILATVFQQRYMLPT